MSDNAFHWTTTGCLRMAELRSELVREMVGQGLTLRQLATLLLVLDAYLPRCLSKPMAWLATKLP